MTPQELLEVAHEAARAAGELLLGRFGTEKVLRSKSTSTDLVSAADLEAEEAIRAILTARVPDDAVMGEEGADQPGTTGRRWIVDPLDGTVNYLFSIPQWCVSVACEGIAGVIFDPVRDELFATTADGPPTLNGEPIAPRGVTDLGQAMIATGFGYDAERRRLQAAIAARILPEVRDIRRMGSAALDLAWVAAGRLDGYFEYGVNPWDTAAGELLCSAGGLRVVHLPAGERLPVGILAAPESIADELLGLIDDRP